MHTKGNAIGIIARLTATGALVAGTIVVTPDVYHDMSQPTIHRIAAEESATTPTTTPDVYHDM